MFTPSRAELAVPAHRAERQRRGPRRRDRQRQRPQRSRDRGIPGELVGHRHVSMYSAIARAVRRGCRRRRIDTLQTPEFPAAKKPPAVFDGRSWQPLHSRETPRPRRAARLASSLHAGTPAPRARPASSLHAGEPPRRRARKGKGSRDSLWAWPFHEGSHGPLFVRIADISGHMRGHGRLDVRFPDISRAMRFAMEVFRARPRRVRVRRAWLRRFSARVRAARHFRHFRRAWAVR